MKELATSAPGRICLFGEHQDYLQLPVVTSAINLRIQISGKPRADRTIHFSLPDVNAEEEFVLQEKIPYVRERDYLRSTVNVLLRQGLVLRHGFDCVVHGTIPINSGTSSSSALIVAWVKFLLEVTSHPRRNDLLFVARMAHRAEVEEFHEPGGMMDHYATSLGGILAMDFRASKPTKPISAPLGAFVLGDSHQAKDTKGILKRVKMGMLSIFEEFPEEISLENLPAVKTDDLGNLKKKLDADRFGLLQGFLKNRDLTRQALDLFGQNPFDHRAFGNLLNRHHAVLRDVLKISTPKIDRMLDAALQAGAYGGKINGSGGGGCMFVYAPEQTELVAEAIRSAGGTPHIVHVDEGARVDFMR